MQSPTYKTDVSHVPCAVEIRTPTLQDAADIWRLVRGCEVLDTNSCYAYLLACRDFASTSLVAISAGQLVGFVVAYIPPDRRDVIFVWQVGVGRSARKQGIGRSLLHSLTAVARPETRYLEATVTPSNTASRRLFESVAEELNSEFRVLPGFSQDDFGAVDHEPEETIRISLNGSQHGNV